MESAERNLRTRRLKEERRRGVIVDFRDVDDSVVFDEFVVKSETISTQILHAIQTSRFCV